MLLIYYEYITLLFYLEGLKIKKIPLHMGMQRDSKNTNLNY